MQPTFVAKQIVEKSALPRLQPVDGCEFKIFSDIRHFVKERV